MTRRPPAVLGLVLAAATLLAGCISIPTSGDVQSATIEAGDTGSDLFPIAEGPTPGAEPDEILEGFIRAGRGPQSQYAVARQYLSNDFANTWAPGAGVIISSSAISPEPLEDERMRVTVSVTAELDAAGRYAAATEGSSRTLEYEFTQEDGEWRISAAPDGTVLPPSSFERIFEPVHLYYFSPGFRFLVPELRWFLATPRTIPTSIARELVAARSEYVESGVLLTAFPSGTQVEGGVTVEDGRARVPFGAGVTAASGRAQWRMEQQLTWSLRSLRDIDGVEVVSASGLPVDIPDLGSPPDRLLSVDPLPIGMREGVFGQLTADEVRTFEGLSEAVAATEPTAAAVGRERDSVAVLTAGGAALVTEDDTHLLDVRPGLIAPSLDPWGYLWSVPHDDPAGLLALTAGGATEAVPLGFDGEVVSIDVSRDGTRLLIALMTSAGPRVIVAGIVRDAEFAPTELVAARVVPTGPGAEVLDASWIDSETVAVLARSTSSSNVTVSTLGGRSMSLGAIDRGVQVVGGSLSEGSRGIRVLTSDGTVYQPSGGSAWTDTGLRAEFLATQQ